MQTSIDLPTALTLDDDNLQCAALAQAAGAIVPPIGTYLSIMCLVARPLAHMCAEAA